MPFIPLILAAITVGGVYYCLEKIDEAIDEMGDASGLYDDNED